MNKVALFQFSKILHYEMCGLSVHHKKTQFLFFALYLSVSGCASFFCNKGFTSISTKLHKQMNLDLNSLVAEGLRSVAFKSVRNIYPCLEYLNLAGDE